MRKKPLSIILFLVSFLVTYVLLCFVFTGSKMAAEATPFDYFRVAISYMAFFKALISLTAACLIGSIPRRIGKK